MDNFVMRTITSRDHFSTDEGDRIQVSASRTINSNGTHWINLRIGDAEVTFDYGGSETCSLVAVKTVIGVLQEVTNANLELPEVKP